MTAGKITITGLRDFQKQLRQMDASFPRQLRLIFNDASQLIIEYDRAHIPVKTGRSRASIKARSSQRTAAVAIGGTKAPWVPWLDFGGEGKRKGRPPARPFLKEGRFTYQGLKVHRNDITDIMARGVAELARSAGLEVT